MHRAHHRSPSPRETAHQRRRRERAERRAERLRGAAEQEARAATEEIERIPPGQPILVGHHSEKRHRRALERSDRKMRRAAEAGEAAERAEWVSGRAGHAISSDDPEAIDALKAKLDDLEEKRARIKEHNKRARKTGEEVIPSFALQNLGAEIRRVKARIAELEARAERTAPEPIEADGCRVEEDVDDNRVRIFFDGKPGADLRQKLKGEGWRWSRANGAWQRQATTAAWQSARRILGLTG